MQIDALLHLETSGKIRPVCLRHISRISTFTYMKKLIWQNKINNPSVAFLLSLHFFNDVKQDAKVFWKVHGCYGTCLQVRHLEFTDKLPPLRFWNHTSLVTIFVTHPEGDFGTIEDNTERKTDLLTHNDILSPSLSSFFPNPIL